MKKLAISAMLVLCASLAFTSAASAQPVPTPSPSPPGASVPTVAPVPLTSGYDWCEAGLPGECLNAWNGGPYVNTYRYGVNNDHFSDFVDADGAIAVQFDGGGSYNGDCIGDYGNSKTDARAGLVGCGSGGIGWGVNMIAYQCTSPQGNGVELWDEHWSAWVEVGLNSGNPVYLNSSNPSCFVSAY